MMFKRILVVLDGSAQAERMLPLAARIVHASQGALVLFTAIDSAKSGQKAWSGQDGVTQPVSKRSIKDATRYLTSMTCTPEAIPFHTQIAVATGHDAHTLLAFAKQQSIDLILLCDHGQQRKQDSIAHRIAWRSTVPLLLLPQSDAIPTELHPVPHHPLRPVSILVALDGSPDAALAIDPATELVAALAAPAKGAIHLTQVVKGQTSDKAGPCFSKRICHIAEALSRQAYRLQYRNGEQQNITVTWSIVVDTDVTSGIIRTAEKGENVIHNGDDLIAMVPHERNTFKHLLTGSKTGSVIKATHLPVFIVPTKREAPCADMNIFT